METVEPAASTSVDFALSPSCLSMYSHGTRVRVDSCPTVRQTNSAKVLNGDYLMSGNMVCLVLGPGRLDRFDVRVGGVAGVETSEHASIFGGH